MASRVRGIRGVITGLLLNRAMCEIPQLEVDRMMRKLGPITDDEMVEITITVRTWECFVAETH